MKVIRIDKTKLLDEVRANREKHLAEFREVAAKYKEQLAAKLLRRMERIDKFNVEDAVERGATLPNCHVNLDIPQLHLGDYDSAIKQLELSTDDIIELSQSEFNQLVMNEWGWAQHFEASKTFYGLT